jgi:murein DD-endopeptidase MepM/ murein hydrolase activator NlpD
VGTPVWAVADGKVVTAAKSDVSGKHVCVRHMNGFETCYLHLSRLGDGIRVGARVSQKQIVGFSGNTGRSTGPHLHFALKRGGQFINPLRQNFPRAEPLPATLISDFVQKINPFLQQLNATSVAAALPMHR